jgi:hypothetical protein
VTADTALTPSLRSRLAAVARRVRLLRVVRGLSLVALALLLAGAAALLADYLVALPAAVRLALFGGWVALGAGTLLVGLVLPLSRRLEAADLAAVVEQKYPELAERLTTTVELAQTGGRYHGSPALIALLVSDTAQRTSRLDFLPAVSARAALALGSAALAVFVLVLTPGVVWPGEYARLSERFFCAWRLPKAAAPYDLEVNSGDILAARGRPVLFSVRLVPHHDGVKLPPRCTLVVTDADGRESRLPMVAAPQPSEPSTPAAAWSGADAFSLAHKVTGDGSYRVEAGDAVSDTFRIRTVVPVELAEDSPAITITPPQYARETVSDQNLNGLADLAALKHSDVTFAFRFTRPAVAARVEWTVNVVKATEQGPPQPSEPAAQPAAGSGPAPKTTTLPLAFADDRRSATLTLPAAANGTYRVVLEAEHGILTELDAKTLTVRPDQPPQVVKFAGQEELKVVLPYDHVPVEITAGDDIGVARADLEYAVNDGEVKTEAMALAGANRQEATAKHAFHLAGKVREGDAVRYRVRIQDNLPPEFGGPHTIYYPADRWLTLKVASKATPLREQEILAQRDEITRRLDAIKAALLREQRGVYKVRQESRNAPSLTPDQAADLKQLRQDNRASEDALRELAREAAVAPALERVAETAREIAGREMRDSEAALEAAAGRKNQPQRDEEFRKSDEALTAALQKLERLKKANEKVAQERLDQQKLEMLAERQQQLAERAAELAAKDPVRDPSAKQDAELVKREQAEVAAELQRLSDQSEALRNALDDARAQQAKELAEQAKELAQAQRELSKAMQETEQNRNAGRLAELARKQQELAERAERLAAQTRQPARTAQTPPLKADEARKAADALQQGNAGEAMRKQEQTAQDLDRLAAALNAAIDQANDPRQAARQLARMEADLRQRVQEETARRDPQRPLADRLKPLAEEQKAIQQAAERLSVPPRNKAAEEQKEKAAEQTRKAAEALDGNDPRDALARMDQAKQNLERLSDQLPDYPQRRQQALQEVARLRQQQEQLAQQARQAAQADPQKQEKQLQDSAKKQAELAEALSKLDAPNQEARREKAQDALNKALADLMDAKPQEAAKSQQRAVRELERLQDALGGTKPADEKVAEVEARPNELSSKQAAQDLAKQQRELAQATQQARDEAAKKPGEEGKKAQQAALEKLAEQQRDLNRKASQTPANQNQKALEQARAAMNQADQAMQRNDANQAQQKQQEAAAALEKLAQKLPDKAPPAARRDPPPDLPGRPTKEQTDHARQLAREQRDLRDEVRRLNDEARAADRAQKDNPLGELAKQQSEIAKQAADLAKNVQQDQGRDAPTPEAQKARQAAQQAADKMQAGATPDAQEAGKRAAEMLRQLAQELAQMPRADGDPNAPDPVRQARDLAQKQEELNRKLAPLADDAAAQRAQQQARQQELQRQADRLGQDLGKLGQQMTRSPQGANSAQQASQAAQQAQQAMQQARDQQSRGNQGAARQSQQQASQALDRAGWQAMQASQQQAASRQQANPTPGTPQPDGQPTGQAVQQAKEQMGQAQARLNQGQAQAAQSAMRQAAQAVQQAAQQLAARQPGPPPTQMGRPGESGVAEGGRPDPSVFGPDMAKYAGKSWGELPGELRTRIIQDMKAKYGDDYARMIKLYFEQIAATPPASGRPPR